MKNRESRSGLSLTDDNCRAIACDVEQIDGRAVEKCVLIAARPASIAVRADADLNAGALIEGHDSLKGHWLSCARKPDSWPLRTSAVTAKYAALRNVRALPRRFYLRHI